MGKFLRRALGTLALFGTTFGGRMNAQEASEKNKQAISTNFAAAQQEKTGNGGMMLGTPIETYTKKLIKIFKSCLKGVTFAIA